MRSILAVLLAFGFLAPETGAAQSGTTVAPAAADTLSAAAAPAPKKKGGMFGKMKGLAKNKIVKTVAKAALCTAVPGGSMIAGAIDAAGTKNVAGAAGVATGGGGGCMPGLAGMAGGAGGGKAGVAAAGIGALGAGISAVALPGQPSTGMPGTAMSPEQLKQMQAQYGKMGMDTAQMRMMQQMMAATPGSTPAAAAAAPASEPASGAPALSREKGRMVVRQLPWLAGSEAVQPGGDPMFGMAMQEISGAMRATTKHYKIEARVEEQGGKAQNKLLAQKRGGAILAALTARGVPAERLTVAGGGADKDPRIVVSEGK